MASRVSSIAPIPSSRGWSAESAHIPTEHRHHRRYDGVLFRLRFFEASSSADPESGKFGPALRWWSQRSSKRRPREVSTEHGGVYLGPIQMVAKRPFSAGHLPVAPQRRAMMTRRNPPYLSDR